MRKALVGGMSAIAVALATVMTSPPNAQSYYSGYGPGMMGPGMMGGGGADNLPDQLLATRNTAGQSPKLSALPAMARMGIALTHNIQSSRDRTRPTFIGSSGLSRKELAGPTSWRGSWPLFPILTWQMLRASTIDSRSNLIPSKIRAWRQLVGASSSRVSVLECRLRAPGAMARWDNVGCR